MLRFIPQEAALRAMVKQSNPAARLVGAMFGEVMLAYMRKDQPEAARFARARKSSAVIDAITDALAVQEERVLDEAALASVTRKPPEPEREH